MLVPPSEKETGKKVKPIYGCEVYFTTDEELRKDVKPKLYHLLLLAKNQRGLSQPVEPGQRISC